VGYAGGNGSGKMSHLGNVPADVGCGKRDATGGWRGELNGLDESEGINIMICCRIELNCMKLQNHSEAVLNMIYHMTTDVGVCFET
jgi:hypothetical protein